MSKVSWCVSVGTGLGLALGPAVGCGEPGAGMREVEVARDAAALPAPSCEGVPETHLDRMGYALQPRMHGLDARQGTPDVPYRLLMDLDDVCGDDVEVSGISKVFDDTGRYAGAIAVTGAFKKSGPDPFVIAFARLPSAQVLDDVAADYTMVDGERVWSRQPIATVTSCDEFHLEVDGYAYHSDPEAIAAWSGGIYVAEENPRPHSADVDWAPDPPNGVIHYFSLDGVDGDGPITASYEYTFSSGLPDFLEGMTLDAQGNFILGTGEEDRRIFRCGRDPGPGGTLECDGGVLTGQGEASSLGTYCEDGALHYSVSADEGSTLRGYEALEDLGGEGSFEWRSNLGADEAVEIVGDHVIVGYDPEDGNLNEIHVLGLGETCMDVDGDDAFSSTDFVAAFIKGAYEQPADCRHAETGESCFPETHDCRCVYLAGDCNRDHRFNSSDLTAAFVLGHYEQ